MPIIHFFVNKVKTDSASFFLCKAFPQHKKPLFHILKSFCTMSFCYGILILLISIIFY